MSNMCNLILKNFDGFFWSSILLAFIIFGIFQTHIFVSSEPDAEPGDSRLIIIAVVTILLILICLLVVVFILNKRFKWGLMKPLRSCVRGKHIAHFQDTRATLLFSHISAHIILLKK